MCIRDRRDHFDRRQRRPENFLRQLTTSRADHVALRAEFGTQLVQNLGRTLAGINASDIQILVAQCNLLVLDFVIGRTAVSNPMGYQTK